MSKKKNIRKISVMTPFFAMHRHARWLLGIFIIATILYFAISHKFDLKQQTEVNRLLLQTANDVRSFSFTK